MNPRDLPSVGAELVSKMHAVVLAPKVLNGGVGRLKRPVGDGSKSLGEEILENSRPLVEAITRGFGLCLYCLLVHATQLRSHVSRRHTLENLLA
ncbi:MAG: hypothetical protein ACRYG7_28585 [Janthinobacterium lividum]